MNRCYECRVCGYVYDPAVGVPMQDIPPGTPFEELPDHWRCPFCKAGKSLFEPLGEEPSPDGEERNPQ